MFMQNVGSITAHIGHRGDENAIDISKDSGKIKLLPMVQKAQNWIVNNAVTLVLCGVTVISTFVYMQFRVNDLMEKNASLATQIKDNHAEIKDLLTKHEAEAKKDIADAAAYGVSARGEAKFIEGMLLGKGIAQPGDFLQYQNK